MQSAPKTGFPLSHEQILAWRGVEAGGEQVCRTQAVVAVRGAFDAEVLRAALQSVVMRHEVLRAAFFAHPALSYPLQVPGPAEFEWQDLGRISAAAWNYCIADSAARPFNLAAGRLLRVTLGRFSDTRAMIHLSASALCLDAPGMIGLVDVMVRVAAGGTIPDPEPQTHQAEICTEDPPHRGWRRLPGEITLPGKARFGGRETVRLPRGLGADFLLACWCTLLGRLMANAEPEVGIAVNGREPCADGIPGVRTRIVRRGVQVRPASTIAETVKAAGDAIRTAGTAVNESAPCEVCFCHNQLRGPWPVGGAVFHMREVESFTAPYKLQLACTAAGGKRIAYLYYDHSLFEPATIAALASAYGELVASAAEAPGAASGSVPLLGAAGRAAVAGFSPGPRPSHQLRPVHESFAEQVERRPHAIAVSSPQGSLSFRDLDSRAEAVAAALVAAGVGPDTLVPVILDRSPGMPIAMLGVLKAAGAYVPIDPAWPEERVRRILRQTEARIVVTSRQHASRVDRLGVALLDVENISTGRVVGRRARLDNLAYVLYTSGSTGAPKGVMVSHRALANHMQWMQASLPLTTQDRVLQKTAFTFDASVWEFFAPLLSGATLVLAPDNVHRDPAILQAALCDGRITVLQLVPSQLRQVVTAIDPAACQSLRRVFCGGGPLPRELCTRFHARFQAELHNLYGPTETTIDATWWTCRRDAFNGRVLIGRPIDGMEAWVLDACLQAVPVGAVGELYLSGAGLARGYLQDPTLTAERFLPNPFHEDGKRLYRTGDLARWTLDGEIEFFGRSDGQIKFLGHRLEPAEIEAALAGHPEVSDAAVTCRGEVLAAYITAAGTTRPSSEDLKCWLRARLPEYMVPSVLVFVDRLPYTASGKLDRNALPSDLVGRDDLAASYVAPAAGMEEELAAIWAGALGLDRVGADDNFFNLGGHSLVAANIVVAVRTRFPVQLTLEQFFQCATVRQLASALESLTPGGERQDLPAIVSDEAGRYQPFPLSGMQEAYWVGRSSEFEMGDVASHEYFEVDCIDLDLDRLEHAWQRVIERHDLLRAIILPNGQQRVLRSVPRYRLEVTDLLDDPFEVAEARLEELRAGWSHEVRPLGEWPLFALRATRVDTRRTRLHWSIDLIQCDARSLQVVIDECIRLYFLEEPGDAPGLTFRDYVVAEQKLRQSEPYRRSRAYWKERLPKLPPAPELPLARSPSSIARPRFSRRTFRLDPETWLGLKQRGARLGLTPAGILLAAYADVIAFWSRSQQITINLPVSNRLPVEAEVNDVVGDFTALCLVGVEASRGERFGERAQRLQRQLWRDLDHRYMSGVEVLRQLARERGMEAARMPVVFTSTLGLRGKDVSETLERIGEVVYRVTQTPQVWLDALVSERGGSLVVDWDVVEELFQPGVVDGMWGAYEGWVKRLAQEEGSWEEEGREGLLPAEQRSRRAAVNGKRCALEGKTVAGMIARRAEEDPEACAIVGGERRMGYGELSRRARRLAQEVRRGERVAVVMEKGWEQIVGVLGILAGGAAYVPIEASWPVERIRRWIEHSGARVVLTQGRVAERLGLKGVKVEELEAGERSIREGEVEEGEEAYVIYTSGTSGDPKGVVIGQAGVVNAIEATNREFGVGRADRILGLTSLTHDMSVYDTLGVLSAGGRVVLVEAGREKDPGHWLDLLRREEVTLWNSVPAYLEMLLEYVRGREQELPESWRLALVGGDFVNGEMVRELKRRVRGIEVVSVGGPTETTLWNIWHRVGEGEERIAYGRPIANTGYEVVNEAGEACPEWVQGEMWCRGVGVMRGYWRDRERTERALVERNGEMHYRTGDLGWWRPEGEIDIAGRKDLQVKVRGQRIELEEIEAELGKHERVKQAAVAVEGEGSGKRLVGYVEVRTAGRQGERVAYKLSEPGLRARREGERQIALLDGTRAESWYVERRSYRRFGSQAVSGEEFGRWLGAMRGVEVEGAPVAKYRYASGGGLYAVRVYLGIKAGAVEGLAGGGYYYQPRRHELVEVWKGELGDPGHVEINRETGRQAGMTVYLVGARGVVEAVYGEAWREFCLLEAGGMAQLLMEEGAKSGIGVCPIGRVELGEVGRRLGWGEDEELLHTMVGGAIGEEQKSGRGWVKELGEVAQRARVEEELKRHLRERVPEYMVPVRIVEVERLPRTAAGKVDRQRLAEQGQPEIGERPAMPASELELKLAGIWRRVLAIDHVPVNTNFFDLGANSLDMVKLHAEVVRAFGCDLPVIEIFRHTTVRALSQRLAALAERERHA